MSMFQTLRRVVPHGLADLGLADSLAATTRFEGRTYGLLAGLFAMTGWLSFGMMSATAGSISYPRPVGGKHRDLYFDDGQRNLSQAVCRGS